MIVRDYEPGDCGACRALFDELMATHRALYPDAEIGSAFRLAGRIFVADDEGRVVGYAGLLWHGRRAELEPIVVARDQRGRGVGRELAERVVQAARDAGAVRVFVRPAPRNREAIMFFHSAGFDVLGRVELQVDLDPGERQIGERIATRVFRV